MWRRLALLLALLPGVARAEAWWSPSHLQLQHAGNIGWIAAGPGWSFWEERTRISLLLGHVPPFAGGPLTGLALKLSLWPVARDLGGGFSARPFGIGAVVHYTFGDPFFHSLPDRYPGGYYGVSTALRLGAFVGSSVGAEIDLLGLERIDLYAELGVTDLELYLLLANPDTRPFFDAFHLALGILLWF